MVEIYRANFTAMALIGESYNPIVLLTAMLYVTRSR